MSVKSMLVSQLKVRPNRTHEASVDSWSKSMCRESRGFDCHVALLANFFLTRELYSVMNVSGR